MKHKILLLGRSFQLKGGVTSYLLHLTKNIDRDKYDIEHFIHGKNPVKWKNIFLPFYFIKQYVTFKMHIKKYQPDIIHINPSLKKSALIRDVIYLRAAKLLKFNVLFFIHGWDQKTSDSLMSGIFWRRIILPWLKRADGYVVLASQFKRNLERFGIQSSLIYVMSTMVEAEEYRVVGKESVDEGVS